MHMRKFQFAPGSYYNICNRSNDEQTIFVEERDYARFLFFILFHQASFPFFNIGRQTSWFVKHQMFNISDELINQVHAKRRVALCAFAIMPNHFHLLVQEKEEGGISRYLQRIQNGYAKYFNAKYRKRGHLFQGSFRAIPVETDEQLLYLSAYIHRNPRSIKEWTNREISYPWSSYQDCTSKNRWGELLYTSIFLEQFSSPHSYQKFVETSTAKLKPEESPIQNMTFE